MENLASNKSEPFTELVFLRQMVHRLNAALSKYQGADVLNVDEPNTVGLSTSADEASANWLTDPTLLSPLIHEYEIHLSTLITKISGLSAENKNCVYKVKVLTEENSRLHSELQEIVQQQIQDVQSSEFPAASDDSALKNLQAQLELVNREKDSAIEMNRETMKLLDKMRQERIVEVSHSRSRECIFNETKARNERLQESNLEMQMAIDTLQKDHQTLTLTATGQLNELRSLQEQLHKAKQVMAKDKCKTEELKAVQTLLNNKVQNLEQEKSELEQKLKIILTEKQNLQNFLIQAESKLAHTLQNVSDAQSQIDSLKIQVVALEKMNAELDGKEISYLMQIREGAQLLDDALLARDSALVREKQKQEDLEKTSAALETIVQEVADRVKSEVGKVKAQCNERMRRLTEEVEALELEATNLKSEADRAKRAKRTVEEELDALSRQRHDKNDRSQTEDLQRRTLNAERARDDAFITIQTLEDKLKRLEMEHDDNRLCLLSVNQTQEQRIKRLQRETEECQHERLHLLESINQYKHDNQKLEEMTRSARVNAEKEFATKKDALEREKKQLEVRLKSMDETNRESIQQLHQMLANQQRITARWKEESKSAHEKYEDKIKDLQCQLSQHRRRCQDLTNKMKLSSDEAKLNDPRMSSLEENNRQLRARLHETQYKLLSATQKLGGVQPLWNSLSLHDL